MMRAGSWLLVPLLLGVTLVTTSCQTRRKPPSLSTASQTLPQRQATPSRQPYALNFSKPPVTTGDLDIYHGSVGLAEHPLGKVGLLQVFTTPQVDFIRIILCPVHGGDCREQTTTMNSLLLTGAKPGVNSVVVQACVNPNRIKPDDDLCGKPQSYTYTQPQNENLSRLDELSRIETRIRELGATLYQVLVQFKADINQCQVDGKTTEWKDPLARKQWQQVMALIQIQLANITNMGPEFLNYLSQGVTTNANALMLPEVWTGSDSVSTPVKTQGSSFVPESLSLVASDPLLIAPTNVTQLYDSQPLYSYPLRELVVASTDPTIAAPFSGLEIWQQATLLSASIVLGGFGGIVASELQAEYAAYQLVSGLLGLRTDHYPCFAFNKAIQSLAVVRQQFAEYQQQFEKLKSTL